MDQRANYERPQTESPAASDESTATRSALWPRLRPVAIGLLAVGVLLFLLAGPVSMLVPATCSPCHASPDVVASWGEQAHANVNCGSCHRDLARAFGLTNSVHLASGAWIRLVGTSVGKESRVTETQCVACHSDDIETIVSSAGLRMSHEGLSEAGYTCTLCHSTTAHATADRRIPQPTMSLCIGCHNDQGASDTCDTCHSTERSQVEVRRIDAEWAMTHGPDWEQMHGMGDLETCSVCHGKDYCVRCHAIPMPHDAQFGLEHSTRATSNRDACTQCHTESFCESCHTLEMPHPAAFLAQHVTIARTRDDKACNTCHVQEDCNLCHARHVHPGTVQRFRAPTGMYQEK